MYNVLSSRLGHSVCDSWYMNLTWGREREREERASEASHLLTHSSLKRCSGFRPIGMTHLKPSATASHES
jgi:hypothetical protein